MGTGDAVVSLKRGGAVALVDQALFSVWGLLVNLYAGRWNAPSDYGVFAICFGVLMFTAGFENAFLLEPMTVFGRSHYLGRLHEFIAAQMRFFPVISLVRGLVLVGAAVAVAGAGGSRRLSSSLIGAAVCSGFLMFGWFGRHAAYVLGRPSAALAGDVSALLVTLLSGAVLSRHERIGTIAPFVVLACAGLALGVVALVGAGMRPGVVWSGRLKFREIARDQLIFGRWYAAQNVFFAVSNHVFTISIGIILGFSAAGTFRAALLVASPVIYFATGLSMILMPALTEDFGRGAIGTLRSRTRTAVWLIAGAGIAYAAVTGLFGDLILRLAFGGSYRGHGSLVLLLAVGSCITATVTGISLFLRAIQWPVHQVILSAPAALTAVVASVVFTKAWGVVGAGLAYLLTGSVLAIISLVLYKRKTVELSARSA